MKQIKEIKDEVYNDLDFYYSIENYVFYMVINRFDNEIDSVSSWYRQPISEESKKYIENFDTFALIHDMQYATAIIPRSVDNVIIDIWRTGFRVEALKNYKPNYDGIKQFL